MLNPKNLRMLLLQELPPHRQHPQIISLRFLEPLLFFVNHSSRIFQIGSEQIPFPIGHLISLVNHRIDQVFSFLVFVQFSVSARQSGLHRNQVNFVALFTGLHELDQLFQQLRCCVQFIVESVHID